MTLYIERFLVDFLIGLQNPKNPPFHLQNTVDFLSLGIGCYCKLNMCMLFAKKLSFHHLGIQLLLFYCKGVVASYQAALS